MSYITYLDYAATNPWPKYKCSEYTRLFNANANYAFGEKKLMRECEERIKTAIGANGGKVVFGGTASQLTENLFTHITEETRDYLTIGSIYEHDAVFRFADQFGGADNLRLAIQKNKANSRLRLIVCLMGVNNVTGRVMPIEEIGKLCKENDAFFVCDMTAMIGHVPIPANIDDWCDCAFWSGHKIGTELGIGAMWLSAKFNDWVGDFKLHGTPNVAGALTIADATEYTMRNQKENYGYWVDLYCMLKRFLEENGIECHIVCGDCAWGEWTPTIHAIRLNGINADALQQYLASKQIYVGLGASACAEAHDYRVLNAFGLSDEEASEVIRVSFSDSSGADDVFNLVKGIKEFKEKYL